MAIELKVMLEKLLILELCNTGKLIFPRPNAEKLLSIKNGEISLEEATQLLYDAFEQVDAAVNNSKLQELTPELEAKFKEWKLGFLRSVYQLDIPRFDVVNRTWAN